MPSSSTSRNNLRPKPQQPLDAHESEKLLSRWRTHGGAALFVCMLSSAVSVRADDSANVAQTRKSILFVEVSTVEPSGKVSTESGSGFIITQNGYAVTASHLLHGANAKVTVSIGSRFGVKLPAYICDVTAIADAVLLQLPDSFAPYQPVSFDDPNSLAAGSHLVSIGFPLTSDASVSSGVLSNKAGPAGLWQVAMPLNFGNSGGPIIDSEGGVVGMVRGGVSSAQEVNFMLPVNLLAPFLTSAGLRWPPFAVRSSEVSPVTVSAVPPARKAGSGQNCHEVVNIAVGLPPQYTKTIECD